MDSKPCAIVMEKISLSLKRISCEGKDQIVFRWLIKFPKECEPFMAK